MPLSCRILKQAAYGAAAGLSLCLTLAGPATSSAATTTTTYSPSTDTVPNPERGFFIQHSHCESQPFVPTRLKRYRDEEKITLMRCVFYLPKTADISAQIQELDLQAGRLRSGGAKMILRFAYTESTTGNDATLAMVQDHLGRLTDSLRRNSDVIAVMESGFVGAWGEGYYTQNFGNAGDIEPGEWADRNAIVERLLRILPRGRKVVVRTPLMKWEKFGDELPATQADFGAWTDRARVGHVNDCFLSSATDQGTYIAERKEDQYTYLKADTQYVPMGGETCSVKYPALSQCDNARTEMTFFHYTYLNARYHDQVLANWTSGGCIEEFRRAMGYRFRLDSVTTSTSVARGTTMPFAMKVFNQGWSRPINSRPVRLVLRPRFPAPKPTYSFALTDARQWAGQQPRDFTHAGVKIPATQPAGTYDMYLSLADPESKLAADPAFAIQLANAGLWNSVTGLNALNRTLTVQ